jgi:hypothetical protein
MASVSNLVDTKPRDQSVAAGQSAIAKAAAPKRTWGLWLTDWGIYGAMTNTAVFGVSVLFTYLTGHGYLRRNASTGKLITPEYIEESKGIYKKLTQDELFGNALKGEKKIPLGRRAYHPDEFKDSSSPLSKSKPLYVAFGYDYGNFFHQRGTIYTNWLMKTFKMGKDAADNLKMVTFSFVDGSLLLPLVRLAEGYREPIARGFDRLLGTESKDPETYASEPQQTGWSILMGRVTTLAAVLLTYKGLESMYLRKPLPKGIEHSAKDFRTVNEALFTEKGEAIGEWAEKKESVTKFFGKWDVAGLAKVSIFEAVYTSICTAGLYFMSRIFAGGRKVHTEQKKAPLTGGPVPVLIPRAESTQEKPQHQEPAPSPKIREAASHVRLQESVSPELAAL